MAIGNGGLSRDDLRYLAQEFARAMHSGLSGMSSGLGGRTGGSGSSKDSSNEVLKGVSDSLRTFVDSVDEVRSKINDISNGFISESELRDIKDNIKDFNESVKDSSKLTKDIEEKNKSLREIETKLQSKDNLKQVDIERLQERAGELITEIHDLKEKSKDAIDAVKERSEKVTGEYEQLKQREEAFYEASKDPYESRGWRIRSENLAVTKARADAEGRRSFVYEAGIGNTAFGKYSNNVSNFQEKMLGYANLGPAMQNIGKGIASSGGFGAKALGKTFSGLGSVVKSVSGIFKGLAGPVSWVISAFTFFADVAGDYLKLQAKIRDIETDYMRNVSQALVSGIGVGTSQGQAFIQAYGQKALLTRQMGAQNLTSAHGLKVGLYADAVVTIVDSMFEGITNSAYKAASTAIKFSADVSKLGQQVEAREKTTQRSIEAATKGYEYQKPKFLKEMEGVFIKIAESTGDYGIAIAKAYADSPKLAAAMSAAFGEGENSIVSRMQSISADGLMNNLSEDERRQLEQLGGIGGTMFMNTTANRRGENTSYGLMLNGIGILSDSLKEGLMAQKESEWNRMKALVDMNYDMEKALIEQEVSLNTARLSMETSLANVTTEAFKTVAEQTIDAAQKIAEGYLRMAQKTEELLKGMEAATNKIGIGMGMTGPAQMHAYQLRQFENARDVGFMWGLKQEEVFAMQQAYSEESGRSRELSKEELNNMAKLGKATGDNKTATSLVTSMQIFNKSAKSASDQMGIMMGRAAKLGLNIHKFSKELVDTMKLATKYNFKGGTKGLMEMAIWAQKTRFNMQSISGMIEKVQEGGLEGVITQSAGFQVLGGHAAMNADPLGMLYDAWADPASYAKRMQDMTKGFGTFNAKTGETEFNINESMQIAQLAKLQGRSAEELRKEIMERNKLESMKGQITGNFTDDELSLLANKAVYNEGTGKWQVQMKNGEYQDVSNLSQSSDLDELKPQGYEENVLDALEAIRTAVEQETGVQIYMQTDQALLTFEEWQKNVMDRLQNALDVYAENREKYAGEIAAGMLLATNSYNTFGEMMKKGNEEVDPVVKNIQTDAKNLEGGVKKLDNTISKANSMLQAHIEDTDDFLNRMREAYNAVVKQYSDMIGQQIPSTKEEGIRNAVRTMMSTKNWDAIDNRFRTGLASTRWVMNELKGLGNNATLNDYDRIFTEWTGDNELRNTLRNNGVINTSSIKDIPLSELKELRNLILKIWREESHSMSFDAIVSPSGAGSHFITGGNVKPINDGAVTHPDDTVYAIKDDGPLGKSLYSLSASYRDMANVLYPLTRKGGGYGAGYSNSGQSNELNVNFGGSLKIEGENGDMVELVISELETDSMTRRRMAQSLFRAMDETLNGNRQYFNYRTRNTAAYSL